MEKPHHESPPPDPTNLRRPTLPQRRNPLLLPPVRRSRVHLPHPHILHHPLPLVRPQAPLAFLLHPFFTARLGVGDGWVGSDDGSVDSDDLEV